MTAQTSFLLTSKKHLYHIFKSYPQNETADVSNGGHCSKSVLLLQLMYSDTSKSQTQ